MSILLVDIGNSRIKWASIENGTLVNIGVAPRKGTPPVSTWLSLPAPRRIITANVAGPEYAAQLNQWSETQWGVSIEPIHVDSARAGIALAYSEERNFGVDRWLALIAAQQIYNDNICVIDCGTAVTIDLLTAQGRHQGGVVLPGLELMQNSLLQRTADIDYAAKAIVPTDDNPLGRDTRDGIIKGTLSAVAGAIEFTVSRIKRETAMPITCVITGGDAVGVLNVLGKDYQHEPHLVLLGIQALVAE